MRELTVIFLCTWKFAATFPVAVYIMNMSFCETLVYTNAGGILGAFMFLNFSGFILKLWKRYHPENSYRKKKTKIFTAANRRFIKIKRKYGLPGIVILSPFILSIPVGAFLAAKYYGVSKKVFFLLVAGQVSWSLVYTVFYTFVKGVLI